MFAWMPIDTLKKTFECTTQLAMEVTDFQLPFHRHQRTRTPQLNRRRLQELFATDTLFSSTPGIGGIKCVQLFVGMNSQYTSVHGLKSESEGPQAFEDFLRDKGAPYGLRHDNSKMQLSKTWVQILRRYNILDQNTEPHNPQQNPAERRIQTVKQWTSRVMDRSGAHPLTWFLCMLYVVMILNFTYVQGLKLTPHQKCFGDTPDVSALMRFRFNQEVFYAKTESFPITTERCGRFMGVAENKGDALTYWVLTDNYTLLARSLVRAAKPDQHPNLRVDSTLPEDQGSFDDPDIVDPDIDPPSKVLQHNGSQSSI